MKQRTTTPLSYLIPVASALILIGAWAFMRQPGVASERIETYHRLIQTRVEEVPRVIGPWAGEPVPVQQAAETLLDPNATLQLKFEHIDTGEVVQLLIVHCGNTKDMIGHYPPRCYPNAGWDYSAATDRERVTIPFNGRNMPATMYTFTRFDSAANSMRTLHVLNFFATPNDEMMLQPDPRGVDRMSRDRRIASLGAANIQVLSSRPLRPEDEVVRLLIREIEPVLRSILEGVDDGE
jgi:hypothetical protein